MRDSNETAWWRKTQQLAVGAFAVLALLTLITVLFPGVFSRVIQGLPMHLFLLAVVMPLFIAGGIFSFAARQQSLDRRHDVADE